MTTWLTSGYLSYGIRPLVNGWLVVWRTATERGNSGVYSTEIQARDAAYCYANAG